MGDRISAEEFTEACVYLREEPLDPALLSGLAELLAGLANGALTKPDKSLWTSCDFLGSRWEQTSAPPPPAEEVDPAAQAPTAAQLRGLFNRMRR